MENNNTPMLYTEEQLMARLKFFIGVCLALTLTGIVFVVLYSLIFVTQPLNAISPIDQKFFELIVPIATFLTGTLSGIMLAGGDKDMQKQALAAANKGWDRPPGPSTPPTSGGFNNAATSFGVLGASSFGSPAAGGFGGPTTGFNTNTGFGAGTFNSTPQGFGASVQQPTYTASGKKIVPDEPQPLI